MKQYKILNNPLTRMLALLWCSFPKRKGAKSGKTERCMFNKISARQSELNTLILVEADPGHLCGTRNEYRAYITDYSFHRLSAKTPAEMKEFRRLVRLFNLHLTFLKNRDGVAIYRVGETINEALFWYKEQLPSGVKPILLMENGSRVKGFWRRNGNVIELYRPNPNSAESYNPLPWRLEYRMGLCYI